MFRIIAVAEERGIPQRFLVGHEILFVEVNVLSGVIGDHLLNGGGGSKDVAGAALPLILDARQIRTGGESEIADDADGTGRSTSGALRLVAKTVEGIDA